ncbi:MAG: guanylate kinase [Syntrophomonadaceae bacterium]|nr:guanylate kinase [Syntrophomonadaceae bacterium]
MLRTRRRGILFVISGPSGVGKGTLRERLLARESQLVYSISATTRLPRPGERHGREYFFVSQAEFERLIREHQLLEWAFVYGNYYGTPRPFVLETLARGQDVLLEIDIQGAMQIKRRFPQGVFVFIMPPSMPELARRLAARGQDPPETIARRLAQYEEEIGHVKDYEYMVVNDQLECAVDELMAIVTAERCRVSRWMEEGDDSGTAFDEPPDEGQ